MIRIRKYLTYLLFAVVLAAGSLGCGSIKATQRIDDAETALEKARSANAGQKAPYQYYRAKEFLYKAKYAWSYSHYEVAIEYATNAVHDAEEAVLKVEEDPWSGHPVESGSY